MVGCLASLTFGGRYRNQGSNLLIPPVFEATHMQVLQVWMLGCEVTHNSEVLLMYDFMLMIGYRRKLTNLSIYIYIMYSNVPLISIVRYT